MAWLMNEDRKWSLRCTGHFGAASEAMLAFYQTFVMKRELSRQAKLWIYQSIVPTLTCDCKRWVVIERMRLQRAAKVSFSCSLSQKVA